MRQLCVPIVFVWQVWATNIHDTVITGTEPLMGAAYHTIHHTHYNKNYGQWFIFFDWLHGTLMGPDYETMSGSMQGSRATEMKKEKVVLGMHTKKDM